MIYTSYFANVKGVLGKKPHIRFCSIAGKTPDWFLQYDRDLGLKSFKCKSLMPHYDWWKVWHDKFEKDLESEESKSWYIDKYNETVLDMLSPQCTVKKLYEMSDKYDVCLLCYETPDKFCHRHLVAEWLNSNGISCKEVI